MKHGTIDIKMKLRKSFAKIFNLHAEKISDIVNNDATEFLSFFSTIPGFENCEIGEITDRLNCGIVLHSP